MLALPNASPTIWQAYVELYQQKKSLLIDLVQLIAAQQMLALQCESLTFRLAKIGL